MRAPTSRASWAENWGTRSTKTQTSLGESSLDQNLDGCNGGEDGGGGDDGDDGGEDGEDGDGGEDGGDEDQQRPKPHQVILDQNGLSAGALM